MSLPSGYAVILNELNRQVIQSQPSDIIQFCANFFNSRLEQERKVMQRNQTQAAILRGNEHSTQANGLTANVSISNGSNNNNNKSVTDSDANDSEEDDLVEDLPSDSFFPSNYNRNRRASVSAESMVPSEKSEDFIKRVIPKSTSQRKRIELSISQNFLFKNLDEDQYQDVLDAMDEIPVKSGTSIIQQGGIGDYFYVVETGSFDCFVNFHDGNPPKKVLDYGPGGSFGELALMYNAPRAATITATSDSVVWALDRVTFRRILMENTYRKRRMYEVFLEEVPLLVSLEPYERQKIADALESKIFESGEDVIRQGDIGDHFYIIESGEAKALKFSETNQMIEVGKLGKGDYFGELALLNDAPRAATIRATTRLKVATLGKKAFTRLLGPVVNIIQRNASNYKV